VTPEDLADYGQAMAWFSTEYPVLLSVFDQAARGGFDTHTWQLAWTLSDYVDRRGHWREGAAIAEVTLRAARRLGDRDAQARTHRILAIAYYHLARFDDAHIHIRHVHNLFGELGDHTGQTQSHLTLASIHARQGRHAEALHLAEQALDLFRAAGDRMGQAVALSSVGWFHAVLGHHQQALTYCQQALGLLEQLDAPVEITIGSRAATWCTLGYTHHHLGHHQEAIACFQQALKMYRNLGARYGEADALTHLGDTQHATGDHDAARTTWQHALDILEELDHSNAEQVRAKLHHLDPPTAD
jgi:tetratricopeptide (TPR) repeat protein